MPPAEAHEVLHAEADEACLALKKRLSLLCRLEGATVQ
jgi:hypothetical protein